MVTAVDNWERSQPNSDSSGSKNAPVVERNAAVATSARVVTMATSQARWIRNGFGEFNRTLLLDDAKSMALASREREVRDARRIIVDLTPLENFV